MRSSDLVNVHLITPAWAAFTRIAPLGIAGIYKHRRFGGQDSSGVHVAEGPIVESSFAQLVHGGGCVIGMAALMADIRVQHSDRIRRIFAPLERSGQVIRHALARVAYARNFGDFAPAANEGLGIGTSSEHCHVRRESKTAPPAVQRIVIDR